MVRQLLVPFVSAFFLVSGASAHDIKTVPAKVARLTPAQKTQVVAGSIKVLGGLLTKARAHVSAVNTELTSINNKRNDLGQKEARLNEKSVEANTEHTKNEEALKLALAEDYKTQTTALIVPRITDLHSTFLNFVDRYRAQVGLVRGSPEYIQGDTYRSTRPAMAEIVRSQDNDLKRVKQIVLALSDFIQTIEREFNDLSNNPDAFSARFGFEHYYTLLLQRMDARRVIAQSATALFNGLNSDGQARQILFRCSGSSGTINTFNKNLDSALGKVAGEFEDYRKSIEAQLIFNFYDGDPVTRFPGYISSWRGCSGNKQNNAENFRRDIEREIGRNNIELARQLDLARGDLEYDITIIDSEAETLQHHSAQIKSILQSARIQGDLEIAKDYPDAWRRTVRAHIGNLKTENLIYPALMQASDLLLLRALNEIRTLPLISDVQNRRAELKLVAEKLQSIRNAGFSRLLEQIDSVNDQLATMTASVGAGESFLEETIGSYALSARTKALYWKAEQDRLPATLANSSARVSQTRDNFNKSLELKKLTAATAQQFVSDRNSLFQRLDLIQTKFGNAQFNPIYSELASQLIESASGNAEYKIVKPALTSAVSNYLSSFKGILTTPALTHESLAAKVKKTKKAKSTLVKALEKTKKSMVKMMPAFIDGVSLSYLGGESLSSLLNDAKVLFARLMAAPV